MNQKKPGLKAVRETNLGIYVWRLEDGNFLADEDLNVLSITAWRGDLQAMSNITAAARNMGFDGSPYFVEGARKISDSEFQMQKERFINGQTPDPYDIGSYKDARRGVIL